MLEVNLKRVHVELASAQAANAALNATNSSLMEELEQLSVELFQEANKMVADERKLVAHYKHESLRLAALLDPDPAPPKLSLPSTLPLDPARKWYSFARSGSISRSISQTDDPSEFIEPEPVPSGDHVSPPDRTRQQALPPLLPTPLELDSLPFADPALARPVPSPPPPFHAPLPFSSSLVTPHSPPQSLPRSASKDFPPEAAYAVSTHAPSAVVVASLYPLPKSPLETVFPLDALGKAPTGSRERDWRSFSSPTTQGVMGTGAFETDPAAASDHASDRNGDSRSRLGLEASFLSASSGSASLVSSRSARGTSSSRKKPPSPLLPTSFPIVPAVVSPSHLHPALVIDPALAYSMMDLPVKSPKSPNNARWREKSGGLSGTAPSGSLRGSPSLPNLGASGGWGWGGEVPDLPVRRGGEEGERPRPALDAVKSNQGPSHNTVAALDIARSAPSPPPVHMALPPAIPAPSMPRLPSSVSTLFNSVPLPPGMTSSSYLGISPSSSFTSTFLPSPASDHHASNREKQTERDRGMSFPSEGSARDLDDLMRNIVSMSESLFGEDIQDWGLGEGGDDD